MLGLSTRPWESVVSDDDLRRVIAGSGLWRLSGLQTIKLSAMTGFAEGDVGKVRMWKLNVLKLGAMLRPMVTRACPREVRLAGTARSLPLTSAYSCACQSDCGLGVPVYRNGSFAGMMMHWTRRSARHTRDQFYRSEGIVEAQSKRRLRMETDIRWWEDFLRGLSGTSGPQSRSASVDRAFFNMLMLFTMVTNWFVVEIVLGVCQLLVLVLDLSREV